MSKPIPAETRIQQINTLQNIEFLRWVDGYKNNKSKAICRCAVDGLEWAASISTLLSPSRGTGCPQCAGNISTPAEDVIALINQLPNIAFVRWADDYKNSNSKAICRCAADGFEWAARVSSLLSPSMGHGCPKCANNRQRSAEDSIQCINARPNTSFVRWADTYRNCESKAVCRCHIDGFEWATSVNNLTAARTGCPQCAGKRRWTAEEHERWINDTPNISFVRWDGGYKNQYSKAVCRCLVDGSEWRVSAGQLRHAGSGCPRCAGGGYDQSKAGTLYLLRSECGSMVKIGISNSYKKRHARLKRATPFNWSCIELLHNNDGAFIAKAEKELHSLTEQAQFSEPFDGYTEWRKWDERIPSWFSSINLGIDI